MKIVFKLIIFVFVTTLFLVACDNDGPAEKVGESIDRTLDETKDSLEDAGEKIDEAANDAERAVEDISD